MDTLLIILGFILMIGGIIGSFIPILPGPITSWLGLLVLHFTNAVPMNKTLLVVTLVIAILIFMLDYIIPAMGTKKFGGSKYGVIGTTIGLIVGLIAFPPFGIIIGPFVGALIGELIYDKTDGNRAVKAAFGSLLGFLTSTFIKFIVACTYFGIFIWVLILK